MDRRSVPRILVAVVSCLLFLTSGASAQDGAVRELGKDLDPAVISEALKNPEPKPAASRSLDPKSCKEYRRSISRGFKVEPVSSKIALTVEFASDSAELAPSARRHLDAVGQALKEHRDSCFWVEGHTDDVNTEAYNLALSERRARAVTSYLVSEHRIDPDQLIEQGLGESMPLDSSTTPEARKRNRRVQISNLGYRTSEKGS